MDREDKTALSDSCVPEELNGAPQELPSGDPPASSRSGVPPKAEEAIDPADLDRTQFDASHTQTKIFLHDCPEMLPPPAVGSQPPTSSSPTVLAEAVDGSEDSAPALPSDEESAHRSPKRPLLTNHSTDRRTPTREISSEVQRQPRSRPNSLTPLRALVDVAKSDPAEVEDPVDRPPLPPETQARIGGLVAIKQHRPTYLTDVVTSNGVREELVRCLREQEAREKLRRHGLAPASHLLMVGPSGTGKEMSAAVLSTELNIPLYTMRLDGAFGTSTTNTDTMSYLGNLTVRQKHLAEAIRRKRGVYFFEQSTLSYELSASTYDRFPLQKTLFVSDLLRSAKQSNSRAIIVFSFPSLDGFPKGLLRQFDAIIRYTLPTSDQIERVLQSQLMAISTEQVDWHQASKAAEGMCHAEIAQGARRAAKSALLDSEGVLTTQHLCAGLEHQRDLHHP